MKYLLIIFALLSLAGCSNRAVYENLQTNKRHGCLKVPQPDYEKCMEGMDKSYQQYEQERQEALEKP